MTTIYACLAGEWVRLNDDPECTIGEQHKPPFFWWEEGAPIYAPSQRKSDLEDSFYGLDYIHIFFRGKDWRINPVFIQIVSE